MSWTKLDRHGIAKFDFKPKGKFQVELKKGEKVFAHQESGGWYRGKVLVEPPRVGIFPANYVKLLPAAGPVVKKPAQQPTKDVDGGIKKAALKTAAKRPLKKQGSGFLNRNNNTSGGTNIRSTTSARPVKKFNLGAKAAPKPKLGNVRSGTISSRPVKKFNLGAKPTGSAPKPKLANIRSTTSARPVKKFNLGAKPTGSAPKPKLGGKPVGSRPGGKPLAARPVKKFNLGAKAVGSRPVKKFNLGAKTTGSPLAARPVKKFNLGAKPTGSAPKPSLTTTTHRRTPSGNNAAHRRTPSGNSATHQRTPSGGRSLTSRVNTAALNSTVASANKQSLAKGTATGNVRPKTGLGLRRNLNTKPLTVNRNAAGRTATTRSTGGSSPATGGRSPLTTRTAGGKSPLTTRTAGGRSPLTTRTTGSPLTTRTAGKSPLTTSIRSTTTRSPLTTGVKKGLRSNPVRNIKRTGSGLRTGKGFQSSLINKGGEASDDQDPRMSILKRQQQGKDDEYLRLKQLHSEIDTIANTWNVQAEGFLMRGQLGEYRLVQERLSTLVELRRNVLDVTLPIDSRKTLRDEIISLIESSRKLQDGFMIPRKEDGGMAEEKNTSIQELQKLHKDMFKKAKTESGQVWIQKAVEQRTKSFHKQNVSSKGDVRVKVASRVGFPAGMLHLHLDVKMSILSVGEPTELYFSLYSNKKKKFITEEYIVKLTAIGMPEKKELIGKLKTIFTELSATDFAMDLYLVCRIFRRGALIYEPKDDTKKKKKQKVIKGKVIRDYRRPFGCAITSLSSMGLETMIGEEFEPKNSAMTIYTPEIPGDFSRIHELLIEKSGKIKPAPRAKGIALGFTLYDTELDELKHDEKMEDATVTKKLEFPEVLDPNIKRNDFYVVLKGGQFLQDKKKSAKNIEILLRVMTDKGQLIPQCIERGQEVLDEYRTGVYYHTNTPCYNEIIRLNVPESQFEKCHLFLQFYHISRNKIDDCFAFAYLKLTNTVGAVIQDGEHKVFTFRPFPAIEEKSNTAHYLHGNNAIPKLIQRKEHFVVRTKLASTSKTQNDTLHSLFRWKDLQLKELVAVLESFTKVDRGLQELAKFVSEIFDVFFGIFKSDQHKKVHSPVFVGFLHTLTLLTNKNLTQYKPIVDTYISSIFSSKQVHHLLLYFCMHKLREVKKKPQNIMLLTKVMNYVIRFIVQSRKLDKESARSSCTDEAFKKNLKQLLAHMNDVVHEESKSSPYIFSAQSYIIRSFPVTIQHIEDTFTPSELGSLVAKFLESITLVPKQNLNKLNLILNIIQGKTGKTKEAREKILPSVYKILNLHLKAIDEGTIDEPLYCLAIIIELVKLIQEPENGSEKAIGELGTVLTHLANVVEKVQLSFKGLCKIKPPSDSVIQYCKVDLKRDSLTLLSTILTIMSEKQIQAWFLSMSPEDMKETMRCLLNIHLISLQIQLYPEIWIIMNMIQHVVTVKLLGQLLVPIKRSCLGKSYNQPIWKLYFKCIIAIFNRRDLMVEEFPEKKYDYVMNKYGDLRLKAKEHFENAWGLLNEEKLDFVPQLVPQLIEIAKKTTKKEIKNLALNTYFNCLEEEFKDTKDFTRVERYTIDTFYNVANVGDEKGKNFIIYFMDDMKKRIGAHDVLKVPGLKFLEHVNRMYELMGELLKLPDTALYEDERTSTALQLMNYLETLGEVRKEMYIRYVQYLVDLHTSLKNFTEAGMTKLAQLRKLTWSKNMVDKLGKYPKQTEGERKEQIFKDAIACFDKGKDWERAIELCKKLIDYHCYKSYDYKRVQTTLMLQSTFFKEIAKQKRFYSNYFRVVYYGDGFPKELTKNEWVYRGVRLETLTEFINRIKKKFNRAKIVMSSDAPTDTSSPQLISITTVKVVHKEDIIEPVQKIVSMIEEKSPRGEDYCVIRREDEAINVIPDNVAEYRVQNDVSVFSYSKPVKNKKKQGDGVKNLWVNKNFLVLEEGFPTNRRRIAVVKNIKQLVSPIETAIRTIVGKNNDVRTETKKFQQTKNIGPLSMLLNGCVDAVINGGTKQYIEAFLTPEYLKDEPEGKVFQERLRKALVEQQEAVREGIHVWDHENKVKPQLAPLLEHLKATRDQAEIETRDALDPVNFR